MSSEEADYDNIFSQVAGRLGGLDPLFNAFFGFLHRKTDFYVEFDPKEIPTAKMGFPPGSAEAKLLKAFRKFSFKPYEVPPIESAVTGTSATLPPVVLENSTKQCHNPPKKNVSLLAANVKITEDGKQIPVGNGGICDTYYWTQTLKEATVYIDVPVGVRGKDITCSIEPRRIHMSFRKGDERLVVLDGELDEVVRTDDSLWTLASAQKGAMAQVIITLEKARDTWWKCVLKGHPEIDTTKVDSTQKIEEYDAETQATIHKIMFNEKQKRLGLPTTDEMAADAILEKAKYLPGSPFLSGETIPRSTEDRR